MIQLIVAHAFFWRSGGGKLVGWYDARDSNHPGILAKRSDVLSPRMMRIIEDLAGDWRRLDERIEGLSADITSWWRKTRRASV
jgi:hypothetical protein